MHIKLATSRMRRTSSAASCEKRRVPNKGGSETFAKNSDTRLKPFEYRETLLIVLLNDRAAGEKESF